MSFNLLGLAKQYVGLFPDQQQRAQISPSDIQFFAHVDFGVLTSECRNFGICKIHVKNELPEKMQEVTKPSCYCLATLSDTTLQLFFIKKYLKDEYYTKYFQSGFFQVDETVFLDAVLDNFEQKTQKKIDAGHYKIEASTKVYYVRFELKEVI